MSDRSKIEWTRGDDGSPGSTWNPIRAEHPDRWLCAKISPGCDNCYASTMNHRFGGQEYPNGNDLIRRGQDPNRLAGPRLDEHALEEPLRWRRPRRVFVESMSDLFGEWVPADWLNRIFAVMASTPQHTYLLLTKRPRHMRTYLESRAEILPNVWAGTTIETAQYTWRAKILRSTPAAVRWISAEPLLGPLVPHHYMHHELDNPSIASRPEVADFRTHAPLDLTGINWLVAGGESGGSPARSLVQPCIGLEHVKTTHPSHCYCRGTKYVPTAYGRRWVSDLRDACQAADTAFFLKQWGGPRPTSGGRLLNARTWDEYPTGALTPV